MYGEGIPALEAQDQLMGSAIFYDAHPGQQNYGKGHYSGSDQHAQQSVAPQPGSNDAV